MRYLIHEDGSFDILGSSILLHNAYPSLNGQMLRPVRIEVKKDTVTYQLVQGSVSIRFREEPDGRIAICCSAGIKNASPALTRKFLLSICSIPSPSVTK